MLIFQASGDDPLRGPRPGGLGIQDPQVQDLLDGAALCLQRGILAANTLHGAHGCVDHPRGREFSWEIEANKAQQLLFALVGSY